MPLSLLGGVVDTVLGTSLGGSQSRKSMRRAHDLGIEYAPRHAELARDAASQQIDMLRNKGATLPEIMGTSGGYGSGASGGATLGNGPGQAAQATGAARMAFEERQQQRQHAHEKELKSMEVGGVPGTLPHSTMQRIDEETRRLRATYPEHVLLRQREAAIAMERQIQEFEKSLQSIEGTRQKVVKGQMLDVEARHHPDKVLGETYKDFYRNLAVIAERHELDPAITVATVKALAGVGTAAGVASVLGLGRGALRRLGLLLRARRRPTLGQDRHPEIFVGRSSTRRRQEMLEDRQVRVRGPQ